MKWDNKTKDKIAYGLAIVAALVGFGLVIAGFVVDPTGEIHHSVQWVLGETLVFSASVVGIAYHARNAINSIHDNINRHVDKRMREQGEGGADTDPEGVGG